MGRQDEALAESDQLISDQLPSWSITKNNSLRTVKLNGHVPAWDGIRALAVMMTCFCHIVPSRSQALKDSFGRGGVNIFLVLSGFLITGVLVEGQRAAKSSRQKLVAIRDFHVARTVRLYPAFLVSVLSTMALSIILQGAGMQAFYRSWRAATWTLMYLADITMPFESKSIWGNCWTLAVEAQFYMLWSIFVPFLLRLRAGLAISIVVLCILTSWFLHLCDSPDRYLTLPYQLTAWCSPTSNFWKMLIGALLRLLPDQTKWLRRRLWGWIGLGLLAVQLLATVPERTIDLTILGLSETYFGWRATMEACMSLSAALMVLGTIEGNALLEHKYLRFIGQISYSLYLYQVPLLYLAGWTRDWNGFAHTILAALFAAFSTFHLEEPIRRWYRSRNQ